LNRSRRCIMNRLRHHPGSAVPHAAPGAIRGAGGGTGISVGGARGRRDAPGERNNEMRPGRTHSVPRERQSNVATHRALLSSSSWQMPATFPNPCTASAATAALGSGRHPPETCVWRGAWTPTSFFFSREIKAFWYSGYPSLPGPALSNTANVSPKILRFFGARQSRAPCSPSSNLPSSCG